MPPPRALRSFYAATPPSTLEEALSWARFFYDDSQSWEQEGFDRPDTLHKVEAPAAALIDLLRDDINRQRIIWELTGDGDDRDRVVATRKKLDETLRFLDELRPAARRAHVARRPGRPGKKADLRAAYNVLVEYWQREHGSEEFTNTWAWDQTDKSLVATSEAAQFFHNALRRIDLKRERLAEELRDLMSETVEALLGPRQGRKGT
jgi:hypothetical protein